MKNNDLIVLFSGGRTSAYMCRWIKLNWEHKYNLHFLYCNTGQEHPKTLEFVNACDKTMGLDLVWIEADVKRKGIGTSYKIVNYETAARPTDYEDNNGIENPFESMVKKFGLPNRDFPHCTRELKIEPMKKWAKDNVSPDYKLALGIRADEPKRLKQSKTDNEKLFPMAHDHPVTKDDVIYWWRNQSFDLEVPEHLGNCQWCWKKSDRKLLTIAKNDPSVFDFPSMLEKKYSCISNYHRKDERMMFRGCRTTNDIFEETKSPFDEFVEKKTISPSMSHYWDDDGEEYTDKDLDFEECADECGSFMK